MIRFVKENDLGTAILDAAFYVHRELGSGLLESVYESVLAREFSLRNIGFLRQVIVPIIYKGVTLDEAFRADLIVEGKILLELKSVEVVSMSHKKQTHTYLRLTGLKLGYILNFGEAYLKNGITRCVNGLEM